MAAASQRRDGGKMSRKEHRTGVDAPTRLAVLLDFAERNRRRHGISGQEWAARVDAEYCRLVELRHRTIPAPDLAQITDGEAWASERKTWEVFVRRLIDGTVRFPVDLEEGWIAALDEPWHTQCRRELAQRTGLWGAVRSPEGSGGDHECWARAMRSWADITKRMGQILADGHIGPQDAAELKELIPEADQARADLTSLVERARQSIGEYEQDNVAPLTPPRQGGVS